MPLWAIYMCDSPGKWMPLSDCKQFTYGLPAWILACWQLVCLNRLKVPCVLCRNHWYSFTATVRAVSAISAAVCGQTYACAYQMWTRSGVSCDLAHQVQIVHSSVSKAWSVVTCRASSLGRPLSSQALGHCSPTQPLAVRESVLDVTVWFLLPLLMQLCCLLDSI